MLLMLLLLTGGRRPPVGHGRRAPVRRHTHIAAVCRPRHGSCCSIVANRPVRGGYPIRSDRRREEESGPERPTCADSPCTVVVPLSLRVAHASYRFGPYSSSGLVQDESCCLRLSVRRMSDEVEDSACRSAPATHCSRCRNVGCSRGRARRGLMQRKSAPSLYDRHSAPLQHGTEDIGAESEVVKHHALLCCECGRGALSADRACAWSAGAPAHPNSGGVPPTSC